MAFITDEHGIVTGYIPNIEEKMEAEAKVRGAAVPKSNKVEKECWRRRRD